MITKHGVALKYFCPIVCVFCFVLIGCVDPSSTPKDGSDDDAGEDGSTQNTDTDNTDGKDTETETPHDEQDTLSDADDDDVDTAIETDDENPDTGEDTEIAGRRVSIGILKVNLLDEDIACSDEKILAVMDDSIDCFLESSFGQFQITANIIGEVTIDKKSSEPCANAAFSKIADEQGIDWSPYEKRIYLFPEYTCGFRATAQGGGTKVWSSVCDSASVLVHEFGHTFGLQHSAIDDFKEEPTIANKYADTSCNMGFATSQVRHFNAPHKIQMDWIPQESSLLIDSPGTYALRNLETSTTETQIIRIQIPATPDHYYLSYRSKIGLDEHLADKYAMKTNIHIWDGAGLTFFSDALDDQESFLDEKVGLVVTQISHSLDESIVEIEFL